MNLIQVIRTIERTAAVQPPIGSIVRNDVFRMNASPAVRYGAFAWLQGEHSTDTEGDLITYDFTFFYVDRLTFNKANEMEIQSVGIEVLENILLELERLGLASGSHTFRTFNQRFSDECAGVFCRVALEVPKGTICSQEWENWENTADFNLDYNKDFDCWQWVTKDKTIYII